MNGLFSESSGVVGYTPLEENLYSTHGPCIQPSVLQQTKLTNWRGHKLERHPTFMIWKDTDKKPTLSKLSTDSVQFLINTRDLPHRNRKLRCKCCMEGWLVKAYPMPDWVDIEAVHCRSTAEGWYHSAARLLSPILLHFSYPPSQVLMEGYTLINILYLQFWVRVMALLVKSLLCQHKDLSSNP